MSRQVSIIAHSALSQAQTFAVFALCIGAGMVLPLTLAIMGFQTV